MTPSADDIAWVQQTVPTMLRLQPREYGRGYSEARRAWCETQVASVPAARRPALLLALYRLHGELEQDARSHLRYLARALETAQPVLTPDEACVLLGATPHECAHDRIEAPIVMAQNAFRGQPYTPAFFAALRSFRDGLKGLQSVAVTHARGEIAQILWQDPAERLKPSFCLSRGVREGLFALPDGRRAAWLRLIRHVDRTAKRRAPKAWQRAAGPDLHALGVDVFAADLSRWLQPLPTRPRVALSTGGRHVLKTLIWFAALADTDALDDTIPPLIDLPYAKPKAAVHLIYAVGFWLEGQPAAIADPARTHLREVWPLAGSRIRG